MSSAGRGLRGELLLAPGGEVTSASCSPGTGSTEATSPGSSGGSTTVSSDRPAGAPVGGASVGSSDELASAFHPGSGRFEIASDANSGAMSGCITGTMPRVRSASRVRKSAIDLGSHLYVGSPAKGAHAQDIRLAPAVGQRQNVDLAQQPSGVRCQLAPKKGDDIEVRLPAMVARRAEKIQSQLGLGIKL